MLNEYSDRVPKQKDPPTRRAVVLWGAIGAILGLLVWNIAKGVLTGDWNW